MSVVNKDSEGKIRASHKKQLVVLGSSLAVAKIDDDRVDRAIRATKARYVAIRSALAFMFVMHGGEMNLKRGYEFEAGPTP